jgi:hypothetical protein
MDTGEFNPGSDKIQPDDTVSSVAVGTASSRTISSSINIKSEPINYGLELDDEKCYDASQPIPLEGRGTEDSVRSFLKYTGWNPFAQFHPHYRTKPDLSTTLALISMWHSLMDVGKFNDTIISILNAVGYGSMSVKEPIQDKMESREIIDYLRRTLKEIQLWAKNEGVMGINEAIIDYFGPPNRRIFGTETNFSKNESFKFNNNNNYNNYSRSKEIRSYERQDWESEGKDDYEDFNYDRWVSRSSGDKEAKTPVMIPFPGMSWMGIPESQCFNGNLDRPEEAREWLRNFHHILIESKWNKVQACKNFEIRMKKSAAVWCNSLPLHVRRDIKTLDKAFRDYYCNRDLRSKAAEYYFAKRRDNEDVRDYLSRLNGLAMKAGKQFRVTTHAEAREHIQHFLRTCKDDEIKEKYMGRQLKDVNELSRMIKEVITERNQKDRAKKKFGTPRKINSAIRDTRFQSSRRGQSSPRRVNFMEESSKFDYDDYLYEEDEYYRDSEYEEEQEYEENMMHSASAGYPPREDWSKMNCGACGRNGHPTHRCWARCKMCLQVHPHGQCERMRQLVTISKWAISSKEELPTEIQDICKSLN